MRLLGPAKSFRRELTFTMAGAFALSAIGSALLVIWITYDRTEQIGRSQARQLVEAVIPESSYGLLIAREQPEVATAFLQSIAKRPEVSYAHLSDPQGAVLSAVGDRAVALPNASLIELRIKTTATRTLGNHWHVVAPVIVESSLEPGDTQRVSAIGHLYVVWARTQYHSLYRTIAFAISIGAFLTLTGGLLWAVIRSRRLTYPLIELSQSMDSAATDESVRARANGTAEIDCMATAFNRLMERLGEHRSTLEQTVADRTANLRQATAAAQAAERFKSAFMAAVSHEMKTPLHAIEASLRDAMHEMEFVEEAPTASAARTHLVSALAQKDQLLSLINQILDYARAQAGRHTLHIATIELAEFLRRIQALFVPIARSHHNRLIVEHEGLPTLRTDPDKLNAIVVNLLSNACTYTQNGTVSLSVVRERACTTLVVEDNGSGIEAHLLDTVWEEFRQGDMGERRATGGTGLGLAVTRSFVQLLGGTASLRSAAGEGTTVTITLPDIQPPKDEDPMCADLQPLIKDTHHAGL